MRRKKQNNLLEILDSDDELPSNYTETADIPAYKRDDRFKEVEKGWLDVKYSKYYEKKQSENLALPMLYVLLNKDVVYDKLKNKKFGEKALISSGVLTADEILCLKSLEATSSDTIFLWFINYLIYKNLQSQHSFLKSCLVSNYLDTADSCKFHNEETFYKNFNYEVVVINKNMK